MRRELNQTASASAIYDRLTVQVRADAFNVANHTNVQTNRQQRDPKHFGEITGYRDARTVQFAGRFDF